MPDARAGGEAGPLVSVLVPVYNGAKYLRESLDSILRQTYPRIEILVLDDASTDDTPAIVASYGDSVRHLRAPVNRGIYGNANAGIGEARGELIAIYHADDVYGPWMVEREVELFERHPEVGAVFCLDEFIDADGVPYARLALPPELRGREVLDYATVLNGVLRHKNRFLVCPTAMVRADVYSAVGLYQPTRWGIGSDLDMWLRIARHAPLGMVHEHLMQYRHFHGNASQRHHHLRTTVEEHFLILDAHLDEGGREVATAASLAAHEGHRAEDLLRIAVSRYIQGDVPEARATLAEIRTGAILRGVGLQRGRLLTLLYAFRVLTRIPRIPLVADVMFGRWFVRRPPRRRTA